MSKLPFSLYPPPLGGPALLDWFLSARSLLAILVRVTTVFILLQALVVPSWPEMRTRLGFEWYNILLVNLTIVLSLHHRARPLDF